MATIGRQSILVGSSRIVGEASVDGGGVRGVGGFGDPQLVVPLTLQVNPLPEQSAIAVSHVTATLTTHSAPGQGLRLGAPMLESLMHGFPARSISSGPLDHTVQLSFGLSQRLVSAVESWRHASPSDVVTFYLHVVPTVAAITAFGEALPGSAPDDRFGAIFGMYARLEPFWYATIAPITVSVERSAWVREVLPGLGHDRTRLLEVQLPPDLPGHQSAAAQFDKARRALDSQRYGDCIEACRGIINMWEAEWGATRKERVAEKVAAVRMWPPDDIRRTFLDELWRRLGDIANAPHHPEGETDAELFDARDARAVLMLTAVLSQYVAR